MRKSNTVFYVEFLNCSSSVKLETVVYWVNEKRPSHGARFHGLGETRNRPQGPLKSGESISETLHVSFPLLIYQPSEITTAFSYSCCLPKYKKHLGRQATNSSSCYYWHQRKEESTEMAACSRMPKDGREQNTRKGGQKHLHSPKLLRKLQHK